MGKENRMQPELHLWWIWGIVEMLNGDGKGGTSPITTSMNPH